MFPGLQFLRPLLTARLLSYATPNPAAKPLEERGTADGRGIFQERPQLHATDKARKDVGEVQVHKAEDEAVDHPHHNDGHGDESRLEDRAPRLAALDPPLTPLTARHGTRGCDACEEVDSDKEQGYGHEWSHGEEYRHHRSQRGTNVLEQYLHLKNNDLVSYA